MANIILERICICEFVLPFALVKHILLAVKTNDMLTFSFTF